MIGVGNTSIFCGEWGTFWGKIVGKNPIWGTPTSISSAFESVDHEAILEFIDNNFKNILTTNSFDLKKCAKSYLDRTANSFDRETNKKLPVTKRHRNRSTPQGSLVSPFFWRVFDGLFTKLFINSLERFKSNIWVHDVFHVSYADDHLSIVTIMVDKVFDNEETVTKKIEYSALLLRNLLDSATKAVGCGINRAKSEIIICEKYKITIEHKNDDGTTKDEKSKNNDSAARNRPRVPTSQA